MRRSFPTILAAAGVSVCMLWAGAARAVTVPYTTALISSFNPTESATPVVTHSAPATPANLSYLQSGTWGSVSALASADLATGQLKARAVNSPDVGFSPYMQTNAWFGDGFRARTPSGPFSWTPESTAQFTMDLTGNSFSASSPMPALGFGQVGGFVVLSLFQPGTLTPSSKIIGDANGIAFYVYAIGNPNISLVYNDPQGVTHPVPITGGYLDLSHDIHIQQDIQPNGDFDWVLLLGAAGQISGPEFYDIDFSHTLTVNYASPAGTTTTTESGLFNNFTAIPEPGSLAGLAVGAMMLARRRGV